MRQEGVLPSDAPPLGETLETDLAEYGFSFIQFSFSFCRWIWKVLKINNLGLVAGGGFEPPTFGL
jgi:hypothetical protein